MWQSERKGFKLHYKLSLYFLIILQKLLWHGFSSNETNAELWEEADVACFSCVAPFSKQNQGCQRSYQQLHWKIRYLHLRRYPEITHCPFSPKKKKKKMLPKCPLSKDLKGYTAWIFADAVWGFCVLFWNSGGIFDYCCNKCLLPETIYEASLRMGMAL